MIFAWINFIILLAISLIHIYWALGGQIGAVAAIPESAGKPLFKPGPIATLVVALSVGAMGVVHLLQTGVISIDQPGSIMRYSLFGISAIFLIRAVGDFTYVGFFKRVKGSVFAKMDTLYYSPLCIVISLNAFFTAITDIQ